MLGSALPDICNIAQVKLQNRSESEDLAQGIDLHHRTDSVFHSHSWFRKIMSETMQNLLDKGVKRGPARACAHVGPELLLDGALLEQHSVRTDTHQAFKHIPSVLHDLATMVNKTDADRWTTTLTRLSEQPQPTEHGDPELVAVRLERILRHRPRLALPPTSIPLVASTLTEIQPTIRQDAAWLAEDLAQQLT